MHERFTDSGSTRGYGHRGGHGPPAASDVLGFGAALTVLVIGVVPAIAIPTGISPLFPLALALGVYGLTALMAEKVVPSIVAAIPVLVTVNADVPILEGPRNTVDLAIALGDLAILAGALLLAGSFFRGNATARTAERLTRCWRTLGWPAAFLTAFAGWALFAAAFAAHDVTTAAVFGLNQFRYVAFFAVAAGLVAAGYATLRVLSVTFAIAMVGHACYAIAQFAYGHTFGMTALGETTRTNQLTITLLGEAMPTGRFLGGLVGNNAAFASLAIPAVAVLVWIAVDGDWLVRLPAIVGIGLFGVLCVPLTQYDSAILGFAVSLGLATAFSSIRHWPRRARTVLERRRGSLLLGAIAATVAAVAGTIAIGAGVLPDVLPFVSGRNLDSRLADYRRAIELGLEHPITGYGGGNVEPMGAELGFSGDFAIHSIALSYLAETGVVGLVLWLGALVTIALRAVRLAWSDHPDAVVATALCAGALGFLVVASFDQIWDNHTSMGAFWLFGGAIAGSYRLATSDR